MASTDPSPDSAESTTASLEQLRDRVTRAVAEILRLREANRTLAQRIAHLESERAPGLQLDDDPEALREKITGFIEALDRFLEPQEDEPLTDDA